MRTRVKICGITREDDALAAARLGADALGFVFFPPSPRNVETQRAAEIAAIVPPFVTRVGLFVDAETEFVTTVLSQLRLDLLQFHGEETPAYCAQFGVPYIKAVRMKPDLDLLQYAVSHRAAAGLLLDSYVEGVSGGTGTTFDWQRVPREIDLPLILSGGLDADNVAAAIEAVKPWAVDVSSGVERAKGIKDAEKMARFFEGVRNATA